MDPAAYVPILALIGTIGAAVMASRSAKSVGEVGEVIAGWKDMRQEMRQDRDYWRERALAAEAKLEHRRPPK